MDPRISIQSQSFCSASLESNWNYLLNALYRTLHKEAIGDTTYGVTNGFSRITLRTMSMVLPAATNRLHTAWVS